MTSVMLALALMQSPTATALPPPPATIALVEAFSDGRVICELTSAKPGWMWIPSFPRIKDWQPPPGSPPVKALQFDRVLIGRDIKVEVSLLVGESRERVRVATVLVRPGEHLVVNELREYGLEPVDLSLAEVTPSMPYAPSVYSVTPDLQIAGVDILTAPYPGYRITVRNVSQKAAANFHVQSYRGMNTVLSSLPRGREGRPVLTPGGSYTFDVTLTRAVKTESGVLAPEPLDVVEIDSVLWGDGSMDGTPVTASTAIVPDLGRRLQLTRTTSILRTALGGVDNVDVLARLRTALDALPDQHDDQLPDARRTMRQTKAAALADLIRFEHQQLLPPDRAAIESWLENTIERYEHWMARLAQ
jgi:hypothetical protein